MLQIIYNKTIKIATINIKGMKRLGLREMVEYWMMKNEIDILAIQETQINTNNKEARKMNIEPKTKVESCEGGLERRKLSRILIAHC